MQAFAAFAVYRDLGPARSVTKVARELDKSRALVGRWSRQFAWVLRATAYDREQDRLFLAEQSQARREVARRQAKLAQAVLVQLGRDPRGHLVGGCQQVHRGPAGHGGVDD
ncbi:hypothetical protein ACFY2B_45430, partial [Streptomyces sp. NPDC001270]